jgi:hypothetical protein
VDGCGLYAGTHIKLRNYRAILFSSPDRNNIDKWFATKYYACSMHTWLAFKSFDTASGVNN